MKIEIDKIDRNNFIVAERYLKSGERVFVVFPQHIGCKWNKHNLIFRSSVWNEDGELVSPSFKKFFNWDEQPDLDYRPFNFKKNGVELMEKLDGSTLIVSKYKGELIVRTRGTIDATVLDNGFEIEELMKRYPKAFSNLYVDSGDYTLIFEWVSPFNKIVLDYGEKPDIYLIGMIEHDRYMLMDQDYLDRRGTELGVKRPKRYDFDSIEDMMAAVEDMEGQEGLCVYCNKGQSIRKVKSAWYLACHKMKSELASEEKVLDLYLEIKEPSYLEAIKYIEDNFDFEIAKQIQGTISRLCDAGKQVNALIDGIHRFLLGLEGLSRKEQAKEIFASYGKTNRAGMVFSILDGRELDKKQKKKLYMQMLK